MHAFKLITLDIQLIDWDIYFVGIPQGRFPFISLPASPEADTVKSNSPTVQVYQ
jgi:hypothetical protein